ncbi:hypothetical protein B4U80_03198 [Leptotrombidium deliense]|uniref:Uncharacterized protein n=1 Tax=Leptotrombidium deliense TaxID=299467 RepID=A0A443S073_9ACAR|nr:hypothetical protein B4U80_03198 [Leptotrombidium deliense]
MKPQPYSIYPLYPRVFHFGACGTNYQSTNCMHLHEKVKQKVNQLEKNLFPKNKLNIINKRDNKRDQVFSGAGGFADPRDIALCNSMVEMRNF